MHESFPCDVAFAFRIVVFESLPNSEVPTSANLVAKQHLQLKIKILIAQLGTSQKEVTTQFLPPRF